MDNKEIIHEFYRAFGKNDAEGMIACYHEEIEFQDPAFGLLKGHEARSMWRMLIQRNKGGIEISHDNVQADGTQGSAKWTARYIFSPTGRIVINQVKSHFEFKEEKIIRHFDYFDLWKWTRQAFGWRGYILGWSPLMQNKIRLETAKLLRRYMEEQTE